MNRKPNPSSVVITTRPKGYVAHIRYADPKFDVDISHIDKYWLYQLIDRKFRRR